MSGSISNLSASYHSSETSELAATISTHPSTQTATRNDGTQLTDFNTLRNLLNQDGIHHYTLSGETRIFIQIGHNEPTKEFVIRSWIVCGAELCIAYLLTPIAISSNSGLFALCTLVLWVKGTWDLGKAQYTTTLKTLYLASNYFYPNQGA